MLQRIKSAPAGADTPVKANQADYAAIGLYRTIIRWNILSVEPEMSIIYCTLGLVGGLAFLGFMLVPYFV